MIPAALGGLRSSDQSRQLRALQDLVPFTAEELASSGEWQALQPVLGQCLTSEHPAVAREAATLHLSLFHSAAPRQAVELCLSVLEAVALSMKG